MKKTSKQVGLNYSEFSKIANVSRQAVRKAVIMGHLVANKAGLINPDSGLSKAYIASHSKEAKENKKNTVQTNAELQRQKLILTNEKLKLDIKIKSENWLPASLLRDGYELYCGKLYTAIERGSGAIIEKAGNKILESGEVTNAVKVEAQQLLSQIINDAYEDYKKSLMENIQKMYDSAVNEQAQNPVSNG